MLKEEKNLLAICLICGFYGLLSLYSSIKDVVLFFKISSISQPILLNPDIFRKVIYMENLFCGPIIYLLLLIGSFATVMQKKLGRVLLFLGSLTGMIIYMQKYLWIFFKYLSANQIVILPSVLPPIVYAVTLYILVKKE